MFNFFIFKIRLTAFADGATVKQISGVYLSALLGLSNDGMNQPTSKERAFAAHQVSLEVLMHLKEWKIFYFLIGLSFYNVLFNHNFF